MERSYLIQRLQKPVGRVNPFAFGGGGGGIAKDNMETLAQIWSFDYMGAAEFEFGAVPTAFNRLIGEDIELDAGAFMVPYSYEFRGWKDNPAKTYIGSRKVYYLCLKENTEDVKTLIALWAKGAVGNTKESIDLDRAMAEPNMPEELHNRIVGWFELDNSFMFFTDEKMWRNICEALRVKVPSKKAVSKKK